MKPLFVCLFFSFLLTFSADIAAQEVKQNPATAAKLPAKTAETGSVAPKPTTAVVKKAKKTAKSGSDKSESKGLFKDDHDGDVGIKYIGTEPASDEELARVREIERNAKPVKSAPKPVVAPAPRTEKAKMSEVINDTKAAEIAKLAEEKAAEKAKIAEAKRITDEKAAEIKAAEQAKLADAKAKAAENKAAAEAKAAEVKRMAEAKNAENKAAAEAKAAEAKKIAEAKNAENRAAAEAKAEEAKRMTEAKNAENKAAAEAKNEEAKRIAEEKTAEKARQAEAKMAAKAAEQAKVVESKSEPIEVKAAPKPAVKPASKSAIRGAHAEFDAITIDLGNIKEDAILERYFEFTNTGSSNLEILECRGSCGCIQPKAESTIVGAGERGRIYVKYVARNKVGPQKPVVTLTTNGSPSVIRLFIETWVEQIPGGVKDPNPAPVKSENN
jgi:Protein of unknown function (DUF1573)